MPQFAMHDAEIDGEAYKVITCGDDQVAAYFPWMDECLVDNALFEDEVADLLSDSGISCEVRLA